MVKIAVAGGSGQVAREVIDALLATKKHEITILSRSEPPININNDLQGVHWRTVNYENHSDLVSALQGIHTVLSFLQLLSDPEGRTQKQLIDAAIAAGMKRFAPSEYGSASVVNMPWWTGKQSTREYLRKINENGKVLEYTLFQPGLFLNYLAHPYKTTHHIPPLLTPFDFQHCRALVVVTTTTTTTPSARITLTSARDLASIIVLAVSMDDDEHPWPETGGITGTSMTVTEIIEMGEKIRGRKFQIERVEIEDLENGRLETSWGLGERHRAVPVPVPVPVPSPTNTTDNEKEQYAEFVKKVTIGMLLSTAKGAWNVSGEFNKLFPEYVFENAEEFLARVWSGKS